MRQSNHRPTTGPERAPRLVGWARAGLAGLVCLAMLAACSPLRLGQPFRTDPTKIKVGHDSRQDVLAKMGGPYRAATDSRGQEVLTWVWADGRGKGEKCIVVLNKNGVVSLVEVVR